MKDLTPAILDAVDLDAPPDILTITVLVPPAHGTLLNGIYGLEMNRYKEMGLELLQRTLPVQSFTMQALRQGQLLFSRTMNLSMLLQIKVAKKSNAIEELLLVP